MFSFTQIAGKVGQTIRVEGFVSAVRIQGKMAFVVLESGAEKIQCVGSGPVREKAKVLMVHGYAAVEGEVVKSSQAPGGVEIQISLIELVSASIPWPIAEKSDIGVKLEWPVARFRERREALGQIAQSQLEFHMMAHLQAQGFIALHSPKLMGAPSESGAEVFEVKYFGEKAYLAQSPQFYKQMAIAAGFAKIYESAPVFRAEPSFSSRHATEFVSFDVELEGVRSEHELIVLECAMIREAMRKTIHAMGDELSSSFPKATVAGAEKVITFAQAQEILGVRGDESLSAEEERRLGGIMAEQGHELVAIAQVPWAQRPFYHMKETADGRMLTRSFELLYRGVEITTGAVREHRYAILMEQLVEKGLSGKGMEFYLESFQLGCPPHGGFGLGLARLSMLFLGLPGIKEASFIPRGPGRLIP
ncbi:amino acid--tRNA ligase-related protein [Janthinobacterium sp. BJB304]|uniref:amino acid--tRNA ligase-related protein n=1 Tax=Janthinobacterium sp. BJB304 TaxID=1572871 RepID=UPI000C10DE89|nr:amino acid--tRNA ligase-related protein [Janthinobacterium sp. BJB304]PHV36953.1 aspartate--tRNA(Asn) ligase [Janthinobacterium sp. BJB304]